MRCKGLIANFPDFIEVSIEDLKIGMSVRVSEIELSKLTLLDAKENAIVSVRMARAVVLEEEEEEGEAEAVEGDSAEGGDTAAE